MNNINLTKSQSKLISDEVSKACALVTGYGGGKSFVLVLKMIILKLKYPQCDLLYLFPIYSMHRDILFPLLAEILLDTDIGYRINKSTGEIFFDCGGRVILKSMENPETIVGFNVLAVLLDELDTLDTAKARLVWQKSIARARKNVINPDTNEPAINQLIVGTTPEGFRFVYQMFKKNKPDNYKLIQASGRENIHLPLDYYDNLKAIYPDALVDAYIEGQFINLAQGAVFKDFNRITSHCDAVYREGEELHISVDFNVNGMNATVYVEREPLSSLVSTTNKAYQYNDDPTLNAVHHIQQVKDTPEMIEVIENKYPRSPVFIYPDASGRNTTSKGFSTSDISLFKDAGFHVRARSKNPRIMNRVNAANSAFKSGLVKVNTLLCPDLTDAFEQQVFNEVTELPEKHIGYSIDDMTDGGTYIIEYRYPITKQTVRRKKLRGT